MYIYKNKIGDMNNVVLWCIDKEIAINTLCPFLLVQTENYIMYKL